MIHPDTDRIRKIMNAIIDAREEDSLPDLIYMLSTEDPTCGTPGCHAGELFIGMIRTMDMSALVNLDNVIEYDFVLVAHMFAGYLFPDREYAEMEALKQWAKENPDLWGNHHGFDMFSCATAFDQHSNIFTPEIITDHWLAVADRIDALPC